MDKCATCNEEVAKDSAWYGRDTRDNSILAFCDRYCFWTFNPKDADGNPLEASDVVPSATCISYEVLKPQGEIQ